MEATKGLGQSNSKGAEKYCLFHNSWFYSNSSSEAAMYIGGDIIVILKTNIKLFCNYNTKNPTKYWAGGFNLVLKRKYEVTGDKTLIYIGYKYIYRKVPNLIAIEYEGITKYIITYLYMYHDQFDNVYICPVYHSLVFSMFFGDFN